VAHPTKPSGAEGDGGAEVVVAAPLSAPRSSQRGGRRTVLVSAGVLIEGDKVLLSERKRGAHLEGLWEFPGGKVEPGEDPRHALVRELEEELGIEAEIGDPVEITFHRYPAKDVILLFFEAWRTARSPEPTAIDVASIRWATLAELHNSDFPPADLDVLAKVRARLGKAGAGG
jgi:8-oxo-dGTP diphosphatase